MTGKEQQDIWLFASHSPENPKLRKMLLSALMQDADLKAGSRDTRWCVGFVKDAIVYSHEGGVALTHGRFSSESNDWKLTEDSPDFVSHFDDLLRKESAKSRQMAALKALIAEQQREALMQENSLLRAENAVLRHGIAELEEGQPCVFETQMGTITERLGQQIEVTYDLPDGPLKHVCKIKGDKVPNEGDMVEARLGLVVVGRPEQGESEFESPLPSFEDIKSVEDPHI